MALDAALTGDGFVLTALEVKPNRSPGKAETSSLQVAVRFDLAPSWLHGSWGSTDHWKLNLLLVPMDFRGRNLQGKGRHRHEVPRGGSPAAWGGRGCVDQWLG